MTSGALGQQRRLWVFVGACAIIGGSFYLYLQSPEMRFVLDRRDGQGELLYFCSSKAGSADAQARAEAAHAFFQDQLEAIASATAKSMQEAMEAANAAGTTPDFRPIEAARADLTGATKSVVNELFECRVGPGQIEW